MRTVTLQLNMRASSEANFSVKTEVIVSDDDQAEEAGEKAADFLVRFTQGMSLGWEEKALDE